MTRVPHVLLDREWPSPTIQVDGGAVHHLRRVLRLADGNPVTYTDGRGVLGAGELEGDLVVRGEEHHVARPLPHLTIAVAPPRVADRARLIVEKLAELGVDQLIWLETAHGEGRPPRPDRSGAWARAALQQSRGTYMLEVATGGSPIGPWPESSRVVVCDPQGAAPNSILGGDQPILGLVGPESGFGHDELPDAADHVSLSSQVLRVETAAIALAVLVRAP